MSVAPLFPLRATYRLQLHEGFTFEHARAALPHIAALGISHLYLSPIFEARRGSTHGYDATDVGRVRAVLGGEPGFAALSDAARRLGVGILLDIVPNHMAASEENAWFRDVLEFDDRSPYAGFFDLSWRADADERRLVLPVLGRPLTEAIAAGELVLAFDDLGFGITYHGRRFPVTPSTYRTILARAQETREDPHESAAIARFAEPMDDAEARAARDRLVDLASTSPDFRAWLEHRAADQDVSALLAQQHYRLDDWRSIDRTLSYRRFFDITDLIGVRVEVPRVFDAVHARVLEWIESGRVTGLRIDHVDGLLDPSGYLIRLREAIEARVSERPVPVLVEKILAHDESLPATWPADGTTGYEFLNALNGLFIDANGLRRITSEYLDETGTTAEFEDVVYEKKRLVLEHLFPGEWRVLCRELDALLAPDGRARVGATALPGEAQRALRELTACLRVYRTYLRHGDPPDSVDRRRIDEAVIEALRRRATQPAAIEAVVVVLLSDDAECRAFAMRWQQLSGPAMAKGLEDTALYTYYPLASANDVGGEPDRAVQRPGLLHAFLAERAAHMPDTLNATSTHDTKRSEDVRARINVLSELPDEWLELWRRWRTVNARLRESAGAPSANEEYLLYQTIVGAWPSDPEEQSDFVRRVQRYMRKAMREAKATTSWLEPEDDHERAVAVFIARILDPARNATFLRDIAEFVARVAPHGALNSLAQVAIKAWAPGVPDFYQGTESWTFDLVDPDNRRPVDYAERRATLDAVAAELDSSDPPRLTQRVRDWGDGSAKMLVTRAVLRERAARPELFLLGRYHPLAIDGPAKPHAFGFAREYDGAWCALVAPRLTVAAGAALDRLFRQSTVLLPRDAPVRWTDVLTGAEVAPAQGLPGPLALLRGP